MVLTLVASVFAQEPAPGVPVQLDIGQAGVQAQLVNERWEGFHIKRSFVALCDQSCEVLLPEGRSLLRFSGRGLNPVEEWVRVRQGEDQRLRGRLGSSAVTGVGIGLGTAGAAFQLGVGIVRLVQITEGVLSGDFDSTYSDWIVAGQLATVTGWGIGSLLIISSLSRIDVEPLAPALSLWVVPAAAGFTGTF